MDRETLARDIDRTCRLHGEFRLRSGRVVAEYFDKYLFESQPELLRRVAEAMGSSYATLVDSTSGRESMREAMRCEVPRMTYEKYRERSHVRAVAAPTSTQSLRSFAGPPSLGRTDVLPFARDLPVPDQIRALMA